MVLALSDKFDSVFKFANPTHADLMQLWDRLQHDTQTHRDSLLKLFISVLRAIPEEVATDFVTSLENPNLDFIQMMAAACQNEALAKVLTEIILTAYDRGDPGAYEATLKLSNTPHISLVLITRLSLHLNEANTRIFELLGNVIEKTAQDTNLDDLFDPIIKACLPLLPGKDAFQLITVSMSKSLTYQMTAEQFDIIWEHRDQGGMELIMKITHCRRFNKLSDEAIARLDVCLPDYDFSKADKSVADFLFQYTYSRGQQCGAIIADVTPGSANRFAVQTFDVPGFALMVRIIESSTNETAVIYSSQALISFMNCYKGDLATAAIRLCGPSFKGPNLAKQRMASFFTQLIEFNDAAISCEDFQISRFRQFRHHKLRIQVNIHNDRALVLPVSPRITIGQIARKIAIRTGHHPDAVVAIYHDHASLGKQYTLAQYHLADNSTVLSAGINKALDKPPLQPNACLAIAISEKGLNNDLLKMLDDPEVDENTQKTIWGLLKYLPVDQKLMTYLTDPDVVKSVFNDTKSTYKRLYYLMCTIRTIIKSPDTLETFKQAGFAIYIAEFLFTSPPKLHPVISSIIHQTITPDFAASVPRVAKFSVESIMSDRKYIHQTASVDLLRSMYPISPDEVCHALIDGIDILQLSSQIVHNIGHILSHSDETQKIYDFYFRHLTQIKEHDELCKVYFTTLASIDPPDSTTVQETIDFCLSEVKTATGDYFAGLLIYLEHAFKAQPHLIPVDLVTLLSHILLVENDVILQDHIINILKLSDATDAIVDVLRPGFSVKNTQFSYDPEMNLKSLDEYVGIKNLGSTCYLNSVLQMLHANSIFRASLMKHQTDLGWLLALQGIIARLSTSALPYTSTSDFCPKFIFNDNQPINPFEQQDAAEIFQAILDKIPKSDDIDDASIFRGKFVNVIENIEPGDTVKRESYEDFFMVSIPVKGYTNFESSFETFLEEEHFVGDNKYFAEELQRKIDAKKYTRIAEYPEFLVVQLKRFEYDLVTWTRYKVNNQFHFPFDFDLAPYTLHPETAVPYTLTGIIVHDGSAECGHYYAIQKINDQWICFNDNDVSIFPPGLFEQEVYGDNKSQQVYGPSAYMLFYARTPTPWETTLDLSTELQNQINEENSNYRRMQSIFTDTMAHFVASKITDSECLIVYVINIILHAYDMEHAPRVILKLRDIDKSLAMQILIAHVNDVFEGIVQCGNHVYSQQFASYIADLIGSLPSAESTPMIDAFISQLPCALTHLQHMGLITNLVYVFCSNHPDDINSTWSTKLVDFICLVLGSKKYTACRNVNLFHFIGILSVIDVSQHDFDRLISISDRILQGSSHTDLFLKYCSVRGCDFERICKVLAPSPSEVKTVLFDPLTFAIISYATTDEQITHGLASVEAILPQDFDLYLSRMVVQKLSMHSRSIRMALLNHPIPTLFRFLCSEESPVIKSNGELIALSLFPTVQPLPQYVRAEHYLTNYPNLTDVSQRPRDRFQTPGLTVVPDETLDLYTILVTSTINFVESIDKDFVTSSSRLTSLLRVMIWMVLRYPDPIPAFVPLATKLFPLCHGPNFAELMQLICKLPECDITAQELFDHIYPLNIAQQPLMKCYFVMLLHQYLLDRDLLESVLEHDEVRESFHLVNQALMLGTYDHLYHNQRPAAMLKTRFLDNVKRTPSAIQQQLFPPIEQSEILKLDIMTAIELSSSPDNVIDSALYVGIFNRIAEEIPPVLRKMHVGARIQHDHPALPQHLVSFSTKRPGDGDFDLAACVDSFELLIQLCLATGTELYTSSARILASTMCKFEPEFKSYAIDAINKEIDINGNWAPIAKTFVKLAPGESLDYLVSISHNRSIECVIHDLTQYLKSDTEINPDLLCSLLQNICNFRMIAPDIISLVFEISARLDQDQLLLIFNDLVTDDDPGYIVNCISMAAAILKACPDPDKMLAESQFDQISIESWPDSLSDYVTLFFRGEI